MTSTMNRPEVRNVQTGNTAVEEFVAACADISRDASIHADIITGEGSASRCLRPDSPALK